MCERCEKMSKFPEADEKLRTELEATDEEAMAARDAANAAFEAATAEPQAALEKTIAVAQQTFEAATVEQRAALEKAFDEAFAASAKRANAAFREANLVVGEELFPMTPESRAAAEAAQQVEERSARAQLAGMLGLNEGDVQVQVVEG